MGNIYQFKRVFIFAVMILIASSVGAQINGDCDGKNILIVGSLGAKTNITGEAKIGLWQNTRNGGLTLFAGIMTDVADKMPDKDKQTGSTHDRGFIEMGYKFRVSEKLFSHSMMGTVANAVYFGTELLYQADNRMLLGVNYKKNMAGVVVYVHF